MSTSDAVTSAATRHTTAPLLPPLVPVHTPEPPASPPAAEPIGRVPEDWVKIHDVDVGGDTIDTLLIGPNGLFAIHVDPDLRQAAVRPGLGLFRAGTRDPEPVKRALRNTEALRNRLAHLPGDLFPYPVLVTPTPGETGHRLGRLLVVRPGRMAEAVWRHVSRPLGRSERHAVKTALGETSPAF